MKVSVFIATSLDGFIARADGDIDWLNAPEYIDNFEDYGYMDFYKAHSDNSLTDKLAFDNERIRSNFWKMSGQYVQVS